MLRLPAFWALVLFSVFAWGAWTLVVHKISPNQSPEIAFPAFYGTFFLALAFSFGLLSSLIWKIFLPTQASYTCIKNGIREGFFLAITSTLILVLFHKAGSISWKEIVLLLLLSVLIEAFFIEKR